MIEPGIEGTIDPQLLKFPNCIPRSKIINTPSCTKVFAKK